VPIIFKNLPGNISFSASADDVFAARNRGKIIAHQKKYKVKRGGKKVKQKND